MAATAVVNELTTEAEFQALTASGKLFLVDFCTSHAQRCRHARETGVSSVTDCALAPPQCPFVAFPPPVYVQA
jgi:hypothetical protein